MGLFREHDSTKPAASALAGGAAMPHGLLIACGILSVSGWLLLRRWYSLGTYYATPGFALDKIPGHFDAPLLRQTAIIFVVLTVVYGVGLWIISTAPTISQTIKLVVVGQVLLSGLVNILIYPVAAIDLFNYLAQFKLVFYYHRNPYVETFLPTFDADPLARLAWPLHTPPPYGPAWLLLGGLPAWLAGLGDLMPPLVAYKSWSFVLVLLCGLALFLYQAEERAGWHAAYAFLVNPLVLFEGVANAHNDVMMSCLLLAALLALKRRSALAGPLLALSVLVKIFAVVLAPVFIWSAFRQRWNPRKLAVTVVLSLVVSVAVVAPFYDQGRMMGGMRQAMEFTQDLKTASAISIVRAYLSEQGASAAALRSVSLVFSLGFILSVVAILWKARTVERPLVYVLLLFFMLASSLQAWYLIPVFGLLALRLNRSGSAYLFVATAMGLLIYPLDIWARFDSALSGLQFHVFSASFLALPIAGFLVLEAWHTYSHPRAGRPPEA